MTDENSEEVGITLMLEREETLASIYERKANIQQFAIDIRLMRSV